MRRHQRITIDLAVQILRSAVANAGAARVDTVPVRLALRCLLPHCPERWPLVNFWESASQAYDLGRTQGTAASFNGIILQLKNSGGYSDAET